MCLPAGHSLSPYGLVHILKVNTGSDANLLQAFSSAFLSFHLAPLPTPTRSPPHSLLIRIPEAPVSNQPGKDTCGGRGKKSGPQAGLQIGILWVGGLSCGPIHAEYG